MTAEQAERVLQHEVGHAIDKFAGDIPTNGLSKELACVYEGDDPAGSA